MTTILKPVPGSTRVYAEPLDAGGPAFLMYQLPAGTVDPLPSLTLAEAWEAGGFFLTQPTAPASESVLETQAAYLDTTPNFFPPVTHASFAWTEWIETAFAAPVLLELAGVKGDPVTVSAPGQLGAGPYGIVLPMQTPVSAAFDGAELVAMRLGYTAQAGWPAPNGTGPAMSLTGPQRFCLAAEGLIGDTTNAIETGFDVSLRYFYPSEDGKSIESAVYPLFDLSTGLHLLAEAVFDPLTPFWTTKSSWTPRTVYDIPGPIYSLTETGGSWTLTLEAGKLRSTLRTAAGVDISLVPVQASFVPQPLPGPGRGWYLAPKGTFSLQTGTAGTHRLLCGLLGTEFVEFNEGDLIAFTPNSAAYAPAYPLTTGTQGGAPLLNNDAVTSWVALIPSTASAATESIPAYYSQPLSSALYGEAPKANQDAPSQVLPVFDPLISELSSATTFPLAPYGGVDAARFNFAQFEAQILAPSRLSLLTPKEGLRKRTGRRAEAANTPVPTTTPQGFLVQVADTSWTQLQFARSQRTDGGTPAANSLQVDTVSPTLREALQSSELFLVATKKEPFSTFQESITIDNWPFTIDVGSPPAGNTFRNVMIFKFGSGKLIDKIKSSAGWTAPGNFNDKPDDVANFLRDFCATAIQNVQTGTDTSFANFVDIIQSDTWSGILALNVNVPLSSLPDQLRGLAAGLDASEFRAHHIGVNVSKIQQNANGGFTMPGTSSMFGLINYQNQSAAPAVVAPVCASDPAESSGYSFRVLTLLVLFANSQVTAFSSHIVLTATTMFGEPIQLAGSSGIAANALNLNGNLERRIGSDGSSVTIYVFRSPEAVTLNFPSSQILNYLEVTRIDFNTLTPAKGSTKVQSIFRFWGLLNFKVMPGLDIFSFGDPDSQSGLSLSNLLVQMNFDSSKIVESLCFSFDATQIALDSKTTAPARKASLFAGLPLTLDTIDSSASGTPQGAGYLPVLVPAFAQKTSVRVQALDQKSWFGIAFVLNFGGMGSLAPLSAFNARIVAAWSPNGARGPQAALLIRLPGTSPGVKQLSLQSVLKLSIDAIVVDLSTNGASQAIVLTFTNIGLSILGKKLPSGAAISVALSGGDANAQQSVGWYASYQRQPSATQPSLPQPSEPGEQP
jgi:hypothetical protein